VPGSGTGVPINRMIGESILAASVPVFI
jgi:hypothetical protein